MKKSFIIITCLLILCMGCKNSMHSSDTTIVHPQESKTENTEEFDNTNSNESEPVLTSPEPEIVIDSDAMSIEEIMIPEYDQMAVTNAFWVEDQVILCYQGLEGLEAAKIISYGIESKLSETLYETGYMNFTDMQVQIDENDILLNVDGMNLMFTKDPIRLKYEIPSLSNEMDIWTIGNGHSFHRSEIGQVTITNNYTAKTFSLEPSYTFTNSFIIREDQQEMMMLGDYEDIILIGLLEDEVGITTLNKEDGILWPEGFVDYLKVQYCDRADDIMIQAICEIGGIYQFYDVKSKTLLSQYPFDDGYVAGFVGDTVLLSPDNAKFVAYNYRMNQEKVLFESNEPSSFAYLDSEGKKIVFDILQYDTTVEQHLYIGTFNDQVLESKLNQEEKAFLSQYDEMILPNIEGSEVIEILTTDEVLLKEWQVDALMDKGYNTDEIQAMSYEDVYSITAQGMDAEQLEAYEEALKE